MRGFRCAVVLMVALASLTGQAHADGHTVFVVSTYYSPAPLHIPAGDTVTWFARNGGHTITSDDGLFDFPGVPGMFVNPGQSFTYPFAAPGVYRYHCRAHGSNGGVGMSGVVVVGTPPATPSPGQPTTRHVPSEYPSVVDAVRKAPEGTTISLAPGTYELPEFIGFEDPKDLVITSANIVLRGEGADPSEVVLDGDGVGRNGVTIAAPGVRVENLTVRGFAESGISIQSVAGAVVRDVVAEGPGIDGIALAGVTGATVERVTAKGFSRAGLSIRECANCGAVMQDLNASDNLYGVLASNAGNLSIKDSVFENNSDGIVIKTSAAPAAPQRGAEIIGNQISESGAPHTTVVGGDASMGAGIWISGGGHDVVEGNKVSGGRYGIVVTGMPVPALDISVTSNLVGGAARSNLAFDGLGVGVCFANNDAEGASSIEAQYPCGEPRPALPDPLVIADEVKSLVGA